MTFCSVIILIVLFTSGMLAIDATGLGECLEMNCPLSDCVGSVRAQHRDVQVVDRDQANEVVERTNDNCSEYKSPWDKVFVTI